MSWPGRIFGIMLKRLHLQNFTVFADADFEFGPGLNVLVGTNGTGKSHVLKVGYAALNTIYKLSRGAEDGFELKWLEQNFRVYLSEKFKGIFQPDRGILGYLIRWHKASETSFISVELGESVQSQLKFGFPHHHERNQVVRIENLSKQPAPEDTVQPVFITAKEVLTLAWISRLNRDRKLPIDETYPDLLDLLRQIELRQIGKVVMDVVVKIERLLGGTVDLEGDRFYLLQDNAPQIEMNLVAEGLRKFAMLAQLLYNGSLTQKTTLFWDEPEANLNPALLQKLAAILAELARQGFQIILATHSTDLLKEFHILSRQKDAEPLPIKYFGLNVRQGEATTVVTTDNFEYLPDVVALEVELEQADSLDEIFAREDRERHANL